jgi:DNA polymerase-3 subunit gamma/tau
MQLSISTRPIRFEDVIGQPHIIKEMLARRDKNNWPQAMLLKGPSGVGKSTVAKIIAMTLNCSNLQLDKSPCGKCPSCSSIIEERWDRGTLQLDGGDSSKKEVSDFSSNADSASFYDKNSIFIIEESDQLSTAAKNSLLKVLEKPRENVYFILLSMVNTGLPPAIQSRCQKFNFKPFNNFDILVGLKTILTNQGLWNKPEIPKDFYLKGLMAIAETAQGSFREAVQLLEKCLIGEYWTPELIKEHLGIVDISSAYQALDKLLALDTTFLYELESLDIQEFFNITYLVLSQASSYIFTKIAPNEYYEERTKAIASNKNLFSLLKVYDELSLYPYLRKSLLLSKFSQYFASKLFRKSEEKI